MSPTSPRLAPDRYTEAQRRTIDAAMELFGDRGVSGTSLQMIADALGVTKAAVYHQFRTKDAIVLAVAEVGMAPLETALDRAEGAASPAEGRDLLLGAVIDLAIARRRWVNALQGDPVMVRLLGSHDQFVDLMTRIYALLLGADDPVDPTVRVRTAILSAAVGGALAHPMVADLPDDTLRDELLAVTRELFGIGRPQ